MTTHYVLIDYENVPLRSLALLSGSEFRVLVFLGPNNRNLPTEFVLAVQKLGNRAEYIALEKSGKNALDFHITYYLGTLTAADPGGCFRIISADTGFDSLLLHLRMQQIDADKVASIEELLGLTPPAAEPAEPPIAPANAKPGAGTAAKPTRKPAAKAADQPVAAVTGQASTKPARTAKKAAAKRAVEPVAEAAASPGPELGSNPPANIKGINKNVTISKLVKLVVENLTKRKSSRPSTVKTLMNSIKSICGDGVYSTKIDAVYEALLKNGYLEASGTKITYPAQQ
jgi:hypothetical protein